jgi:predicted XRE-type DNA-binding protein
VQASHCCFCRRHSCAARLPEEKPEDGVARFGYRVGSIEGVEAVSKPKKAQTFTNVWDALEDSPEGAANMTMRSNVMAIINATVRGWDTTQAQAARRLGITQPRLNDLLHGKINKFSLDTLMTLATRAELKVKIDIRPVHQQKLRGMGDLSRQRATP